MSARLPPAPYQPAVWAPSRPGHRQPAEASGDLGTVLPAPSACKPQPRLVGKTSPPASRRQGLAPDARVTGASPHRPPHCLESRGKVRCRWEQVPALELAGCGWTVAGGPQAEGSSPLCWPGHPPESPSVGHRERQARPGSVPRAEADELGPAHFLSLSPGLPTHLLREDAIKRLHLLSCCGRLWLVVPVPLVRQTEGCSEHQLESRDQGSLPRPPTDPGPCTDPGPPWLSPATSDSRPGLGSNGHPQAPAGTLS